MWVVNRPPTLNLLCAAGQVQGPSPSCPGAAPAVVPERVRCSLIFAMSNFCYGKKVQDALCIGCVEGFRKAITLVLLALPIVAAPQKVHKGGESVEECWRN